MFAFLIVALIVFAVVQKRRYCRYRLDGRRWDDSYGRYDFESWVSHRFDKTAGKFERKLRRKLDRQTRKYGLDTADPACDSPPPQFKTEAERLAYRRARMRAAAQTGFYLHLMWYGLVIGLLFIINLFTSHYPWFLWPAAFWGFGVASHFTAVFGWRWIHDRVFAPAIEREVRREVMQEKEALRSEKQASLDELTATFAHEIRNPIAAAKSLVQQMGEDPTSGENVEYARVALDELARVERSVSHLLKYAKEEDYHFENVNLAGVLDGALTQMRGKIEANKVMVSRAYLNGPIVRADADKLRQVFSNVIDNAIDAMGNIHDERRLELSIRTVANGQDSGARMAAVSIRDNGCGIPADQIKKIFNPFYTSKKNGTGLGLGVARKVIDAHRGDIQVSSQPGTGTEFTVLVPLAPSARDERQSSSGSSIHNGAEPHSDDHSDEAPQQDI